MSLLAAAFVATSAYSAWNSYQAGQDQADAFKDAQKAKRKQARDLMERVKRNAEFTRLQGDAFKGQQKSIFASSGVDVGSGMALSAFEDTANKIERQIEIDRMVAETQRDAILMDANLDSKRAEQAIRGGTAGAIGQLGQTAFMLGSA